MDNEISALKNNVSTVWAKLLKHYDKLNLTPEEKKNGVESNPLNLLLTSLEENNVESIRTFVGMVYSSFYGRGDRFAFFLHYNIISDNEYESLKNALLNFAQKYDSELRPFLGPPVSSRPSTVSSFHNSLPTHKPTSQERTNKISPDAARKLDTLYANLQNPRWLPLQTSEISSSATFINYEGKLVVAKLKGHVNDGELHIGDHFQCAEGHDYIITKGSGRKLRFDVQIDSWHHA